MGSWGAHSIPALWRWVPRPWAPSDPQHLSGSGCSFLTRVLSLFPLSEGHRESPAREGPPVPQECRERMALT